MGFQIERLQKRSPRELARRRHMMRAREETSTTRRLPAAGAPCNTRVLNLGLTS